MAQSFFGVFKPQGRAVLHMHALIWTMINSSLFARCSKRQLEFVTINTVIASWIHQDDVNEEKWEKVIPKLNQQCTFRKVPKYMNHLKLGYFSKGIMYMV